MFLKNYLPRSEKNKAKNSLKYLKFTLMFLFFCTIILSRIIRFFTHNNTYSFILISIGNLYDKKY